VIFTLYRVFCGFGLHSLEDNSKGHNLARETASRICEVVEKIGDWIMRCRGQRALHLARRLYIAITWYGRFGNDSQPSPSPALLSDRGCPAWFFASWAEAASRVGREGGESVAACRRWLAILIVILNDEVEQALDNPDEVVSTPAPSSSMGGKVSRSL
jgi:hypothetical protein